MKTILIAVLFFCSSYCVNATIFISCSLSDAPSSETNGGDYTCETSTLNLWLAGGTPVDMFDHVTGSECYGGTGGCAKFYPKIAGDYQYRSFGEAATIRNQGDTTRRNLRYLVKWNSIFVTAAAGYKGDIAFIGAERSWTVPHTTGSYGGSNYQITFEYKGTDDFPYIHGNGETGCVYYQCCTDPSVTECTTTAPNAFFFTDYTGQWVCIELEYKSDGTSKIYVWTQDGVFNGEYMSMNSGWTGTPIYWEGFGGVHFTNENSVSGAYWMVDEIVMSDTYIGPPEGFSNVSRTAAGVTFSGASLH